MYQAHQEKGRFASSKTAIYSPLVPVFRSDAGELLEEPWRLWFLTCAAPIAHHVGAERSRELLESRIHRVLQIAEAYGHETLVLGAWGCGAFGNDPVATAEAFKRALEGPFNQAFTRVTFAITSWGPDRPSFRPFADVFDGYAWGDGVVDPVGRLERLRNLWGDAVQGDAEPSVGALLSALSTLAEQDGWLWPELDHIGWHLGEEGAWLLYSEHAMPTAKEHQIAKAITTVVRLHGAEHLAGQGRGGVGIRHDDLLSIVRGLSHAAGNRLDAWKEGRMET